MIQVSSSGNPAAVSRRSRSSPTARNTGPRPGWRRVASIFAVRDGRESAITAAAYRPVSDSSESPAAPTTTRRCRGRFGPWSWRRHAIAPAARRCETPGASPGRGARCRSSSHHAQAREDGRGRLGGEPLEAAGEVRDVDAADLSATAREAAAEELTQRRLMLLDLGGGDRRLPMTTSSAALQPRQARRDELEGRRQVDVHEHAIRPSRRACRPARRRPFRDAALRGPGPSRPAATRRHRAVPSTLPSSTTTSSLVKARHEARDKPGQRRLQALRLVEDRDDQRQRGRRAFGDRRGSVIRSGTGKPW